MTMTNQEIAGLARTAGRTGREWMDWTCDDAVQAYVDEHDHADTEAWETAYFAGVIERRRVDEGWLERWTTAPASYDSFGSMTLETIAEPWHGRQLRRVLIHPHHVGYHEARYGSGLHGTWEENPRLEEQRWAEQRELEQAERDRRAVVRVAGLAWLGERADLEIEELADRDDDEIYKRELTQQDVRAERERRRSAELEARRVAELAECRALVREGNTLIDDGEPARRGKYGMIPGRNPHVYYSIVERGCTGQTADYISIESSTGDRVGSLASVAARLRDGVLRVATAADDLPPPAVLKRIGASQRSEIRRVTSEDRTIWVGRPRFAADPIVLDADGHKVRRRKDLEAAIAAFHARP